MATKIEWTEETWNPLIGCSKCSPGCKFCYAIRMARRLGANPLTPQYDGLTVLQNGSPNWTGEVRLDELRLLEPLKWRKPRRVFVNSMSDLFHESVPDEWIDRIFSEMQGARRHTFQVLTKRASRMEKYFQRFKPTYDGSWMSPGGKDPEDCHVVIGRDRWPLPNVWLGVSVEDQKTAELRIPELLSTPAAIRFVSYEPALEAVNFKELNLYPWLDHYRTKPRKNPESPNWPTMVLNGLSGETSMPFEQDLQPLHWLIIGGESGPGARPFNIEWARKTIRRCRAAGVACFVKQLGAKPYEMKPTGYIPPVWSGDGPEYKPDYWRLADPKGGDPDEWPADLRVRQFPVEVAA